MTLNYLNSRGKNQEREKYTYKFTIRLGMEQIRRRRKCKVWIWTCEHGPVAHTKSKSIFKSNALQTALKSVNSIWKYCTKHKSKKANKRSSGRPNHFWYNCRMIEMNQMITHIHIFKIQYTILVFVSRLFQNKTINLNLVGIIFRIIEFGYSVNGVIFYV